MTKSAKNVIKKDVKKYKQLAEYSLEEENRFLFQRVANCIEDLIEKANDKNKSRRW